MGSERNQTFPTQEATTNVTVPHGGLGTYAPALSRQQLFSVAIPHGGLRTCFPGRLDSKDAFPWSPSHPVGIELWKIMSGWELKLSLHPTQWAWNPSIQYAVFKKLNEKLSPSHTVGLELVLANRVVLLSHVSIPRGGLRTGLRRSI